MPAYETTFSRCCTTIQQHIIVNVTERHFLMYRAPRRAHRFAPSPAYAANMPHRQPPSCRYVWRSGFTTSTVRSACLHSPTPSTAVRVRSRYTCLRAPRHPPSLTSPYMLLVTYRATRCRTCTHHTKLYKRAIIPAYLAYRRRWFLAVPARTRGIAVIRVGMGGKAFLAPPSICLHAALCRAQCRARGPDARRMAGRAVTTGSAATFMPTTKIYDIFRW